MPSWHLVDARLRAAKYPDTFHVPPREVIRKLKPGDLVHLIFEIDVDDPHEPSGERMWVEIAEVLPNEAYLGELANEPVLIEDLEMGDEIEFDARHVIHLQRAGPVHPTDPHGLDCLVSHRVLFDGRRVGWLRRYEPVDEEDSGWRITANEEPDAYLWDERNHSRVTLRAVLRRDESIRDLLDEFIGTGFVRNIETGQFEHDTSR